MAQVKILVVEDELLIAEDIRMQLIKLGYSVTDIVTSYNEAIHSIMANLPDLVMCDINIDGTKDGIALGEFLRNEAEIPFIYLTSYSDKETVERAKQTRPDAFLVKPFKSENLYTSIEMALAHASQIQKKKIDNFEPDESHEQLDDLVIKDSFFIKKDHHFIKLKIQDIKYIKSDGNYLEVYKSKTEHYVIRNTIKNIIIQLPSDTFFQTHKSHIINLTELAEVGFSHVMVDGIEIPLSKNRKDLLFSKMNTFS